MFVQFVISDENVLDVGTNTHFSDLNVKKPHATLFFHNADAYATFPTSNEKKTQVTLLLTGH